MSKSFPPYIQAPMLANPLGLTSQYGTWSRERVKFLLIRLESHKQLGTPEEQQLTHP